ncbi:hypothetical protein A3750_14315 [Oleiphilus sp. HI0079]|uniref:hypothetical protein n=1 Tax=Oleiphilus sp. HI0079 TaxID=1822254 RepID=UPI0007C3682A|nr:hypothetical protein [Oleiphilus sp. HI0079]KZZ14544.1 hypothetical protein A3750_14315 [Oleiphilus sp. HI0079]
MDARDLVNIAKAFGETEDKKERITLSAVTLNIYAKKGICYRVEISNNGDLFRPVFINIEGYRGGEKVCELIDFTCDNERDGFDLLNGLAKGKAEIKDKDTLVWRA